MFKQVVASGNGAEINTGWAVSPKAAARPKKAVSGSMQVYKLEREQFLPQPVEVVYSFFSRPENLQVITPPWFDFRMVKASPTLAAGSRIRYRLRWRGVPIWWTTEITEWDPPRGFVDRELHGPYALWNHEHRFAEKDGGTVMRDCVTYALPLRWLGQFAHWAVVRRDVENIFEFRAQTMRRIFADAISPLVNSG